MLGGRCPHLICNAAHMNGGFAALPIILHYNTTKSKGLTNPPLEIWSVQLFYHYTLKR